MNFLHSPQIQQFILDSILNKDLLDIDNPQQKYLPVLVLLVLPTISVPVCSLPVCGESSKKSRTDDNGWGTSDPGYHRTALCNVQ